MDVRSCLRMVVVVVVTVVCARRCLGHGRLTDPPSRATAWRFGWNTPIDYNDNQGFCGGFTYQYQMMDGKCGICGDPWDQNPRQHEVGGLYATGTIVKTYSEGQVIPVRVDVTANHMGYFEFRICPNNNPTVEASETCLNEHPLFLADGSGFRHHIDSNVGEHLVYLKLPEGLTCTQCVLQWRYVAANNWGICEDGKGQVGCGPQEEFRACADVAITTSQAIGTNGSQVPTYSLGNTKTPAIQSQEPLPTASTERPTTSTQRPATTRGGSGHCRAVGRWQQVPGMDDWCKVNCNHNPPHCPASHCTCY